MRATKRAATTRTKASREAVDVAPQAAVARKLFVVSGTYDEGYEPSSTLLLRADSALSVARWLLQSARDDPASVAASLLRNMNGLVPSVGKDEEPPTFEEELEELTPERVLELAAASYVDGDSSMKVTIDERDEPIEI